MLESPHHQYQLCTPVHEPDGSGNQATPDIIQNGIKNPKKNRVGNIAW
jgi:hypothetical protein